MMAQRLILLVISLLSSNLVSAILENTGSDNIRHQLKEGDNCTLWMYRSNENDTCTCGVTYHQIVKCNDKTGTVRILDGYIMTYNEEKNIVEAGQSLYGWRRKHFIKGTKKIYYDVNVTQAYLNSDTCGWLNREGRLCGKCQKGYCPLVYSYKLLCANCSNTSYNAVKFTAVAFIPLTVFYLFVIFFKFNANFPSLQAYILGAQTVGAPAVCRFIIIQYDRTIGYALLSMLLGIWNLDFFRPLYPDICLHISSLTAISLEYAIAFYPLFLIFLTYTVTRLYSKGYKVVAVAWRPFKNVIRLNNWDSKSSLIDVMATFMLLSYTKILSVNFDLLNFTHPFDLHGNFTGVYLYSDPTIKYFGKEHLPYGIMAILFTFIFNILPFLLLLFYPMKWFQRCLNYFKLSHVALHTFVESTVGYYKDGTEQGTRDCRYFAAMFLLLRIVYYIALAWTKNMSFIIIYSSACTVFVILFVICKPYKAQYSAYNTITVVLFLVGLALVELFLGLFVGEIIFDQEIILYILGACFAAVPPMYVTLLSMRWIWKHNPLKLHNFKFKRWQQERSMTTATLFAAAETRSQSYGTL